MTIHIKTNQNYSTRVLFSLSCCKITKCQNYLDLPLIIFVRFLDLDWILVNLPVKSLGSNMSNDRVAIRSSSIPSCPWLSISGSRSWQWPLQWSEALLSAPGLMGLFTSSWDMSPVSAPRATGVQLTPVSLVKARSSSELPKRHYMMVHQQVLWGQTGNALFQKREKILTSVH